jgi:hypothetical protein
MQETCGKCELGVIGPDKDGGSWSVCSCRAKGSTVLGMLCTVCGHARHFDGQEFEDENNGITVGGTPGCCDEPVEYLCVVDVDVQKEERRSSPRKG